MLMPKHHDDVWIQQIEMIFKISIDKVNQIFHIN